MELSQETLENYQKNLWCLREVTEDLLGCMKGHDFSFLPEITDKNGAFDQEKLCALVKELVSGWADYRRQGIYPDRPGEESPAEPYLRARQTLYSLYFYLTMRCSLCQGAYALARDTEEEKERTDFAFLLAQARLFSRSWCVMEDAHGVKWNVPYQGFDDYFGFHLYHVLVDPENKSGDSALTPLWRTPAQSLQKDVFLTNEGTMKRVLCKRSAPPPIPVSAPAEEPGEEDWEEDEEDYGGDYDPSEEEGWEPGMPFGEELPSYDLDAEWEESNRASWLTSLAASFHGREEYIQACEHFASLYREAAPEVLHGFYEELEEIVNLYLLRRGLSPLADTDKALEVYTQTYDGPRQQAKRYARGLLWSNL